MDTSRIVGQRSRWEHDGFGEKVVLRWSLFKGGNGANEGLWEIGGHDALEVCTIEKVELQM